MNSRARHFVTGLSSFGSSLLRSLAALRFNPIAREPAHITDARNRPKSYFYCEGCGDGPWHWSRQDIAEDANDPTKAIKIAPCCSGGD